MKIKVILLLLLFSLPCSAAFPAGLAWNVRTTGSDANGGGFDPTVGSPGTNYSLQDSPQTVFTDLIIGATTTQGTSVLHPFDSTSPGNIVNVPSGSGCTVQRVEVISVSGSTATFDKSLGTAASTCSGNLGGAFLTVGAALAAAMGGTAATTTETLVHVKGGTYTVTSSIGAGTSGTVIKLRIQGYSTTPGDGGMATITTATNSVDLFHVDSSVSVGFVNLILSNTASTRAIGIAAIGGTYPRIYTENCVFDGFTYHILGDNNSNTASYAYLSNTEFKNATTNGVWVWWDLFVDGCYFHNNAGVQLKKVSNQATTLSVRNSLFSGGTTAIAAATGVIVIHITNNSLVSQTSDAVSILAYGSLFLENNIIYGAGGWAVNTTSNGNDMFTWVNRNNAYGSNTSGNLQGISAGINDKTLTANPFASSTDFAPNATSGGGVLCKGAGFPTVFPGGLSTGAPNIGAVQASGGSASVVPICSIGQ